MKKNPLPEMIFLILLLVLASDMVFAQEPVLTFEKLQKLDKGRQVYLNSILDDGRFLVVSQDPAGLSKRLLLLNPRGNLMRRIELPSGRVEYVATPEKGNRVMIYSQDRHAFYQLNLKGRRWTLLDERSGAEAGFALFGGRKSKLMPLDEAFYAWGYFYDTAGEYASEWMVLLDLREKGPRFVTRLVEMTGLGEKAHSMASSDGNIDFIKAGGDWMIFTFVDADGAGALFGYRFSSGELFVIERFRGFYGGDVSADGRKASYVIEPRGDNTPRVLFVYDFEKRLPVLALPGEFFNPVFSKDVNRLAVGKSVSALNRVVASGIIMVPLNEPGRESYPLELKGQLIDWKFTGRDGLTVVTKEGNIYRLKI